jgi:hypothetical protein
MIVERYDKIEPPLGDGRQMLLLQPAELLLRCEIAQLVRPTGSP